MREHKSVLSALCLTVTLLTALSAAQAQGVITFASDHWDTFDADPAVGPANHVGLSQNVCVNWPCPPGSTRWTGYYIDLWSADLTRCPSAYWIWAPGLNGTSGPSALAQYFFSRQFFLSSPPQSAYVLVAADDYAEVRINGVPVGNVGSTTEHGLAMQAQSTFTYFDLKPHLALGINTITIHGRNGEDSMTQGLCTDCQYYFNPAGVVFCGEINY